MHTSERTHAAKHFPTSSLRSAMRGTIECDNDSFAYFCSCSHNALHNAHHHYRRNVTVHRVWPKNDDVESKDTGISIQILSFAYLHHLLLFPEQKCEKCTTRNGTNKVHLFRDFFSRLRRCHREYLLPIITMHYAYVGVGSCLHLFILLALARAPIHGSTSDNDCLSMNMHSVRGYLLLNNVFWHLLVSFILYFFFAVFSVVQCCWLISRRLF